MNKRGVEAYLPPGAEVLWSPDQIADGVQTLATELGTYYTDLQPDTPPLLIGILPEAAYLLADLIRKLRAWPLNVEHLTFSNFSEGSGGHLLAMKARDYPPVEGRDVTFVHTRVVSGRTMTQVEAMASHKGAASIGHVALIGQEKYAGGVVPPYATALTAPPEAQIFGYGIPYRRSPVQPTLATLAAIYTAPLEA